MHNKVILIFSTATLILLASFITPHSSFGIEDLDSLLYPKEEEKTISLDFTNARLNDVLKALSQQSGLNFIASTDIASKKINLYLENVSVNEALKRILSANNLTYETDPDSNIFVVNELVTPVKQVKTRVYLLKFATVPSSKLLTTLSIGEDEEEEEGEEDESGIVAAVESVLTSDGSVIEDTRTNSLIVSDTPSQFPIIEETIAKLDVRIPQVLIEAEMLDISQSTADLLGAKFGSTPVTFTGAQRDLLLPFNQNKAIRNVGKSGGQGFTFVDEEYRVGTLSFEGLAVTLQFLRTQTDTKNLARPRIRILNNDTAEISISTDEAIGIASITTASEGTSNTVATAERVQTGVFLRVTPQANVQTREITMAIEPRVTQATTGGTFSGQTFKDPEERGSKSILRVRDGDTIILGGLLRTNVDDIKTRVPFLGKIPVLGHAFRHRNNTESQRELIIFITPHIITDDAIPSIASSNIRHIREQSIPASKSRAIDRELSYIEERKFSSYK